MFEDIGRHLHTRRRYCKATLVWFIEVFVLYRLQKERERGRGKEKKETRTERAEVISKGKS